MTIAGRSEDSVHHNAVAISTSMQTDRKSEADISTQTGDSDDETTAEAGFTMETDATGEDSLSESVVGIAEDEEPFGIITEEVVIAENNVYDNVVFRAERVEMIDNFVMNHILNSEEKDLDETEPENAESNPNESSEEGEIVAEENSDEETVPLEISSSLLKAVADCVGAGFAAVSVIPYFAAVKSLDPSVDEAIPEDRDEGSRDISDDGMLIETAEPESDAVAHEVEEENGVRFVDDGEDSTPGNGDSSEAQLSLPLVTEILVEVESTQEDVIADDAPIVEDVPGRSEELAIVEGLFNELINIEELPEDSLDPPGHPPSSEVIPIVVIEDFGPDRVVEAGPSPVTVIADAVEMPEEAIEALAQELSAIVPPEPAVYIRIPLEEEVILATTFVPLSGELEARRTFSEEQHGTVSEEAMVELMEPFSNEVLVDERADTPQRDSTGESEPSVLDKLVEESDALAESLMEDADEDTTAPSVAAVEEPAEPNPVTSEEHAEERMNLIEPQALEVIFEANKDKATEEMIHEAENSGDVLVAIEKNSEDSQMATSDEPVQTCVKVVLETTEDECNHVTSEEVSAATLGEGETEEEAEDGSGQTSTDSTRSREATEVAARRPDMEALLFLLQSACTSFFEESAYRLVCLKVSSVGHTIVVTIHVASQEEELQ